MNYLDYLKRTKGEKKALKRADIMILKSVHLKLKGENLREKTYAKIKKRLEGK